MNGTALPWCMGMWEWDVVADRIAWDERQYRLFGRQMHEGPSDINHWLQMVHPDDRATVAEHLLDACDRDRFYDARFRIVCPDGQVRSLGSKSFKIKNSRGQILRLVGVNWEVNEDSKKNEEEERSFAISAHAARLASLGSMAANIAHEINNPLFTIQACADRLEREADQDGKVTAEVVREMTSTIHRTVGRISGIVRGLRILSRDESADPWVVQDLREVVGESLEWVRERFETEGIGLKVELPEAARTRLRPVQISQILLNLLTNAADALRGRPEPWVRVSLTTRESVALLRVEDSGAGVPLELRQQIFVPFFTTKEAGMGTGLGLGISADLAQSHGGELGLDEDFGPGAAFVLTLPLATAQE